MNINRFYQSSIAKWVFFLVLLLCVTVTATSTLLFSWYENDNIALYSEMTQTALLNTSRAIESLDSSLKSTGFLMAHDQDFTRMMRSNSPEMSRHEGLQKKLTNMRLTHEIISSAFLVNKQADWLIGSPNLVEERNAVQYSDYISGMLNSRDAIVRINTHKEIFGSREIDVLSYVYFLNRSPEKDDSFLIFNIRYSEFTAVLEAMRDGGELIVLDQDGNIVLSTEHDRLYDKYGNLELLERIAKGEVSDYFVYGHGIERVLVSYVKCNTTHFTYITETPYKTVQSAANALRVKTFLLSAVILFAGILIAVLLARHFYKPLRRLVEKYILSDPQRRKWIMSQHINEYELIDKVFEETFNKTVSMDSFINETIPVIRQDYLKKLLDGKIRLGLDLTHRLLDDADITFKHEIFQVVVINLDNPDDFTENTDIIDRKQHICKIAEEIFSGFCLNETVWDTSDDYVVVILNHPNRDVNTERLAMLLSSIQNQALSETGIVLSIAAGNIVVNSIQSAYKNAMELLLYKIKYNNGTILTLDKIMDDIDGNNQFPEIECNQLIAAVKSLSAEGCEKAIYEIVRKFYKYSINDIMQALNHILYKAIFAMRYMIKDKNAFSRHDFIHTYEMLMKYKSLQELEATLNSFFGGIVHDLDRALNGSEAKSTGNMDHVIDFIKKEYPNPNLSLDYVAEYANLNASYLGRLFFENTGVHFPEYISRLRLEAAKELLTNTEESVNHIAMLVGFNSTTYFITCFKKYTGVTPSKYR